LDVSANPFYEVGSGKKTPGNLPLPQKAQNDNKKIEDTSVANVNSNIVPVVEANANTNTNLVPASVKNSNTSVKTVAPPTADSNISTSAFSFAVIGDTQSFEKGNPKGSLQKAVNNIVSANVGLVMTEGDLVSSCDDNGCPSKFTDWKTTLSPILAKTKEVRGNHDRSERESSDKIWQDAFDLPTNGPEGFSELVYSFDFQNSHFVVLDSEKPEEHLINKTQRDWLEKDLTENTKENIFVFFHEPAYPVSSKINESLDVKKDDRDALWDILKSHKVTAVFNGHEHIMSSRKVDGLYQFVIGNTDAFDHDSPKPGVAEWAYRGHHYAIVTVKGKEIAVNVYKVDGTLLNSLVIPR
jgi:predicted phosphodiesterase